VLAQQRVEHSGAGISLEPPVGWHAATLAQVQANRERVRLTDPEWQHALQTRSALPLLAFTKYEESHAGINPSIQITLRPALAGTPTALLTNALQITQRMLMDFHLVSPVRATTVSGWPAARAEASYLLGLKGNPDAAFRVETRFWLVPRGPLMFLIGMSGSESGPDVCEDEFAAALQSLTIQK
jgi:hypothetical protein